MELNPLTCKLKFYGCELTFASEYNGSDNLTLTLVSKVENELISQVSVDNLSDVVSELTKLKRQAAALARENLSNGI